VATPLERQFGRIAAVNQMTSTSQLGSTSIVLQFDLNRNIDAAGRDVQAAINAARSQLPANLPSNPTYRKANPADAPILILALTSDTETVPQSTMQPTPFCRRSWLRWRAWAGILWVGRRSPGCARSKSDAAQQTGRGAGHGAQRAQSGQLGSAKGQVSDNTTSWNFNDNDQLFTAISTAPDRGVPQCAPVRLGTWLKWKIRL